MAGSTQTSREIVNTLVRERMEVGQSLVSDTLKGLWKLLGRPDSIKATAFCNTLETIKYNERYRNMACFTLSRTQGTGRENRDYILKRTS